MVWRSLRPIAREFQGLASYFLREKLFSIWSYSHDASKFQEPVFLAGFMKWKSVTLLETKQLSPDSKMFVFSLGDPNIQLGLPIGHGIGCRATISTKEHPEGEIIMRAYTPTSKIDQRGIMEIPIKIYYKGANPNFPEGGIMTQYLDTLKPGDILEITGPKGRLTYLGNGNFDILSNRLYKIKHLGLIAGGSGITPCFQLIQYIIDHNEDITLSLIYANRTENDILLRDKLDEYEKTGKLKVYYTLDIPSETWKYGRGFITPEMLENWMPAPSEDTLICYCGNKPMNEMLAIQLKNLGHSSSNFFKY